MTLEFSGHNFEIYSNIKFHENLFSGSRVVPCRWMNRWADMTKLTVAFCNFANAPAKASMCVFTTTIVVSPNPFSLNSSTLSVRKTPENIREP